MPLRAERITIERIAVIGSGSWGTTLAAQVTEVGHRASLWVHDRAVSDDMSQRRENVRFLPGVSLPDQLEITADPAAALDGAEVVVLAVPMRSIGENLEAIGPYLPESAVLIGGTKGLDPVSGERVSQVLARDLNVSITQRFAALSGPNLAREVAAHEPATAVVASDDAKVAERGQRMFSAPWFRTYTSDDLIGVELAGALKNVIGICAGMADGLRYGQNAKAALVTRGLAEMTRLGIAAGANPLTFAGIAGVGDLVATSTSRQSRNHYIGEQLAQGRPLDDILSRMVMVAEGIDTARGAHSLSQRLGVEMPIVKLMNDVLFDGLAVTEAADRLMSRELIHELHGIDRP